MISVPARSTALLSGSGLLLAAVFGVHPASGQSSINFPIGGGNASPSSQTCVQAQIGNEKPSAYDCLDQQLRQQAQGANPAKPVVPFSANSSSNAVGTFNEQGVVQQYGQNFGKSVIPYRPPTPVYGNSMKP